MSMSAEVAAYRRHKLGSTDARPRIVAVYTGAHGWRPVRGDRLDEDVARTLLSDGVTIARVVRRFSRTEVALRRYLGRE